MSETREQEDTFEDEDEKKEGSVPSSPSSSPTTRERPVPPIIEGYLLKLKHKPSSLSSWNKRYFKIDPDSETLNYFNNEKESVSSSPCKVFKLSHIYKVHSVDNFSFQIIFKGSAETVVFLRANSGAEKMRWVHHLHLYIRELTAYANWLCLSNLSFEPDIKECSGYLSKLKRTPTSFSTSWNNRFFKINTADKTLEYFNKEPKEGKTDPSDRRVIDLGQVVEVRVVDAWTFQIEVQESVIPLHSTGDDKKSAQRVASLQLRSGGMNYFCLQAKTPGEQIEWRAVIENYVVELAKHRNIKSLQERALDHRRSVTFNAMEMELERVMQATAEDV